MAHGYMQNTICSSLNSWSLCDDGEGGSETRKSSGNYLRKHSRSPNRKEPPVEGTCAACNRRSRANTDTPEYWRRVRSLSRENRMRMDARENQLRLAELEEIRRRKYILERRKNERDDLANRFLRNPLKAYKNASIDSEDTRPDKNSIVVSRSVPDLEEAYRTIREEQIARARSQTLTNSTYESWAKQSPFIQRKFAYSETFEVSHSASKSKREQPMVQQNQKAYPTRTKEELKARHSRYHRDDHIPFSSKSRSRRRCERQSAPTSLSSDSSSLNSSNSGGQSMIIVQKPKFIRRRSMPDLGNCKCINSTVVFESVASLDTNQSKEDLLILQRNSSVHSPELFTDVENSRVTITISNQSERRRKNMNSSQNSIYHQSVLDSNMNNQKLYSKGNKPKTSNHISKRKEWVGEQLSKKELQRKVVPAKDIKRNEEIDTCKTVGLVYKKKQSSNSDETDSSYYDSLEEDNIHENNHKNAFYIPLNNGSPKEVSAVRIELPEKIASKIDQRYSSLQRPKTASSSLGGLKLQGTKVQPLQVEALLLSGNHEFIEVEDLNDFTTGSVRADFSRSRSLSNVSETSTSFPKLQNKSPKLCINEPQTKKSSNQSLPNRKLKNGGMSVTNQVFHANKCVNQNKLNEPCMLFSNPSLNVNKSLQSNKSETKKCLHRIKKINEPSLKKISNVESFSNDDDVETVSLCSETNNNIEENQTYSIDSNSDSLGDLSVSDEVQLPLETNELKTLDNGITINVTEKLLDGSSSPQEINGFAFTFRENLLGSCYDAQDGVSMDSENGNITSTAVSQPMSCASNDEENSISECLQEILNEGTSCSVYPNEDSDDSSSDVITEDEDELSIRPICSDVMINNHLKEEFSLESRKDEETTADENNDLDTSMEVQRLINSQEEILVEDKIVIDNHSNSSETIEGSSYDINDEFSDSTLSSDRITVIKNPLHNSRNSSSANSMSTIPDIETDRTSQLNAELESAKESEGYSSMKAINEINLSTGESSDGRIVNDSSVAYIPILLKQSVRSKTFIISQSDESTNSKSDLTEKVKANKREEKKTLIGDAEISSLCEGKQTTIINKSISNYDSSDLNSESNIREIVQKSEIGQEELTVNIEIINKGNSSKLSNLESEAILKNYNESADIKTENQENEENYETLCDETKHYYEISQEESLVNNDKENSSETFLQQQETDFQFSNKEDVDINVENQENINSCNSELEDEKHNAVDDKEERLLNIDKESTSKTFLKQQQEDFENSKEENTRINIENQENEESWEIQCDEAKQDAVLDQGESLVEIDEENTSETSFQQQEADFENSNEEIVDTNIENQENEESWEIQCDEAKQDAVPDQGQSLVEIDKENDFETSFQQQETDFQNFTEEIVDTNIENQENEDSCDTQCDEIKQNTAIGQDESLVELGKESTSETSLQQQEADFENYKKEIIDINIENQENEERCEIQCHDTKQNAAISQDKSLPEIDKENTFETSFQQQKTDFENSKEEIVDTNIENQENEESCETQCDEAKQDAVLDEGESLIEIDKENAFETSFQQQETDFQNFEDETADINIENQENEESCDTQCDEIKQNTAIGHNESLVEFDIENASETSFQQQETDFQSSKEEMVDMNIENQENKDSCDTQCDEAKQNTAIGHDESLVEFDIENASETSFQQQETDFQSSKEEMVDMNIENQENKDSCDTQCDEAKQNTAIGHDESLSKIDKENTSETSLQQQAADFENSKEEIVDINIENQENEECCEIQCDEAKQNTAIDQDESLVDLVKENTSKTSLHQQEANFENSKGDVNIENQGNEKKYDNNSDDMCQTSKDSNEICEIYMGNNHSENTFNPEADLEISCIDDEVDSKLDNPVNEDSCNICNEVVGLASKLCLEENNKNENVFKSKDSRLRFENLSTNNQDISKLNNHVQEIASKENYQTDNKNTCNGSPCREDKLNIQKISHCKKCDSDFFPEIDSNNLNDQLTICNRGEEFSRHSEIQELEVISEINNQKDNLINARSRHIEALELLPLQMDEDDLLLVDDDIQGSVLLAEIFNASVNLDNQIIQTIESNSDLSTIDEENENSARSVDEDKTSKSDSKTVENNNPSWSSFGSLATETEGENDLNGSIHLIEKLDSVPKLISNKQNLLNEKCIESLNESFIKSYEVTKERPLISNNEMDLSMESNLPNNEENNLEFVQNCSSSAVTIPVNNVIANERLTKRQLKSMRDASSKKKEKQNSLRNKKALASNSNYNSSSSEDQEPTVNNNDHIESASYVMKRETPSRAFVKQVFKKINLCYIATNSMDHNNMKNSNVNKYCSSSLDDELNHYETDVLNYSSPETQEEQNDSSKELKVHHQKVADDEKHLLVPSGAKRQSDNGAIDICTVNIDDKQTKVISGKVSNIPTEVVSESKNNSIQLHSAEEDTSTQNINSKNYKEETENQKVEELSNSLVETPLPSHNFNKTPEIVENENSKSPSSDSGVLDLTGPSNNKNASQCSPKHEDSDSEHDSESMTVLEYQNTPITNRNEVARSASKSHNEFPSNGELPNTPISSESETSSQRRKKFVHSFLSTLEENTLKGKLPTSKKTSKKLNKTPQLSSMSSDDDGDTSSESSSKFLHSIETRRRRRYRPRPKNIDAEDYRSTSFRPPSLTNLDSFLASMSRFTAIDESTNECESRIEDRNGVHVEIFSGTQGHNIKVKSESQVRLYLEVSSASATKPQKSPRPSNTLVKPRDLESRSGVKQKPSHKRKQLPLANNISNKDDETCQMSVEGSNIQKCFSIPSNGAPRPLLHLHNRVTPTSLTDKRKVSDDPKAKEQKKLQRSIKAIKTLLKNI